MKNFSLYRFINLIILTVLLINSYSSYSIANAAPASVTLTTDKIINLAWFYKPPANGDLSSLAQNYSTFILTRNDESQRDTLFSLGVTAPIMQYIRFEAIQDPGSCASVPLNNQAAFKVGDFCEISQNHPDWFLLDAQGKRIFNDSGYYLMDPGNQGWRNYLLTRIQETQEQRGWFGVFLDNVEGSRDKYERKNTLPVKYPNDASYQAAVQSLLQMLYTSYFHPQNRPLMANIIEKSDNTTWFNYLQFLDGAMEEGWAVDWSSNSYLSESDWLKNLTMAEQTQNNGKYAILISQGTKTNTTRQKFAFASYLLISNGRAAFRYANYSSYNQNWLYSNYTSAIGNPLGPRYQSGGIWKRDFTNGSVSVDPIKHTASIQITSSTTRTPTSQPSATATLPQVTATHTSVPPTATPSATQTPEIIATTYDDTDPGFNYSSGWTMFSENQALNGSYMQTSIPKESVEFTFTGTSFSILYSANTNQGTFDVYVDNVLVGNLIEKASERTGQSSTWTYKETLTQGPHTLKLVFAGPSRTYGSFDGLVVYNQP